LHVHVVARSRDDAAWPKPVWGAVPAAAYDPGVRSALISDLRKVLQIGESRAPE